MDIGGLTSAIVRRLKDDTGPGGLFASGAELVTRVYINRNPNPPASAFPYLQLNLSGVTNADAMDTGVGEVHYRVNVFMKPGVVDEGATDAAGWAVLERVKGDWEAQASGHPSFGLHRWQPTLTGNWIADICEHIDSITQHEDDALHWVHTYRVFLSRQGA